MAKAERDSLIRRKEEEDHWLFTLCWVPGVCVCVCVSVRHVCLQVFAHVSLCVCICVRVARHGRWCQYELARMAVSRPNNRLQQVRGAFNTSKHTGRAAHWCQIRRTTSHTDQQWSEGQQNWFVAVLHSFFGWMFFFGWVYFYTVKTVLKSYLSVIKSLKFYKLSWPPKCVFSKSNSLMQQLLLAKDTLSKGLRTFIK